MQTPVGTRCEASAPNFSRGCNQPASVMKSFGLIDNMAAEMPNEYADDDTPCVAQNPTSEESSALVHGRTPCTDWLPQANVTGAPVQDGRARSEHATVQAFYLSNSIRMYTLYTVHTLVHVSHMPLMIRGVPIHLEMRMANLHILCHRFRK